MTDWSSLFEYRDGQLFWRTLHQRGFNKSGLCAGTENKGYLYVRSNKLKRVTAVHRIIWEMFNGDIPSDCVVDHIDRDTLNNRVENLRLASRCQNALNAVGKRSRKHLLPKNVYRDFRSASSELYFVKIVVDGKVHRWFGLTLEDATNLACKQRILLCGNFARSGYEQ